MTVSHTKCVDVSMTCFHTKFHMSDPDGSLVIAIKLKVEEN
jgi:hypothetical protein